MAVSVAAIALENKSGAFSVLVFTVEMDSCAIPPISQRTRNGWGTQDLVNTYVENALIALGNKSNRYAVGLAGKIGKKAEPDTNAIVCVI
jgi:hypothetical protein